jgi:hypothetical protein
MSMITRTPTHRRLPVRRAFAANWLSLVLLAASTPPLVGCSLVQTSTNTNVADGKLYEPGNADYDAFFKELYDVQLLMGEGPSREETERARVAKALDLPETATTEAIGDGVYERAAVLTKAGVMVKLSLAGIRDASSPSATMVTIGEPKEDKDKALIEALDTAVKADAKLLGDIRKTRSPIERLRGKAADLDRRIDSTFSSSRSRRAEVRQNLDDARQLIPLMVARGDELQRKTAHFLTQLQKVLGTPTSPEGPTEPPEKAGKKPKGAGKKPSPEKKAVTRPAAPPRAIPKNDAPREDAKKPAPEAKAPAEAKKAPPAKKPPPEDFEP